ncbi:MAG: TonB-dependent receptor, partial [Dokdonella sp.]
MHPCPRDTAPVDLLAASERGGVRATLRLPAITVAAAIAFTAGAQSRSAEASAIDPPATPLATVSVHDYVPTATPTDADTHLDGAELERRHLDALGELADAVPNLRIGSLGGRAGQHLVSLRGLINPWSAPETSVLLRIDGVPIGDPLSFDQRLFDIERVDVLAGPQPTAFGANAEAGAIDIVTRRPDARKRTWAQVGTATRGGFETGGGASGALAADLYGSIAALIDGNDGAIDNRIGAKPYDAQRDRNVHGRLVWEPTPASSVEAVVFNRATHDHGGEVYLPVDLAAFNALPTLEGQSLGRFDQALDHEGSSRIDATLAAITARWHGDSIALSAQFSTRRSDQKSSTDYDLSPQPWFVMDSSWRVREHTAELRAESATPDARVQWSTGFSADHRDLDTFRLFNAGPGNPFLLPPGGYVRTDARLPDLTESAYGEARIALDRAQRWQFTLGARMQWTQRALDFGANAVGAPAAALQRDDRAFLPKATLDWSADASTHLYASLAQNGKPGGFNPGTFSADQSSYAPEHLRATEVGAHGRIGDDAFEWRLAAFRNRVHDYQDLTLAESQFTTYVRNVHRASMRGLEASADWRPIDAWRIGAHLGRVDAQY